ncbi:MAG: hypothetical protein AAGK14_03030 [Verrucomicrobiota bacterium]
MTSIPDNWRESTTRRAELIHQQLGALQQLVASNGGDEELLQAACAPYYEMLEKLYLEEMPLAKALDESDLLLHLEGEAVEAARPKLTLINGLFGDMRRQVGGLIKLLAGALREDLTMPKEIDLGLSSFARGSLYLGFCLPEPGPGQTFLPGDPFLQAAADSLRTLGEAATLVESPDPAAALEDGLPDPAIRDAALSALARLAPTGRKGISSVAITGRALPGDRWHTLTPDHRHRLRGLLEQPVLSEEAVTYRGTVREIDLDASRLDLRGLELITDGQAEPVAKPAALRVAYPEDLSKQARSWLDQTLTVTGRTESYRGLPRLLHAERVAAS